MRLYTVTNRQTGDVTLVEADSQAQAIRTVCEPIYIAATPTPLEAMSLREGGAPFIKAAAARAGEPVGV